mmetsp:Transcript_6750/g.14906  ORF Transcript_6750/g.14906 Transcript_6750/m.14906 type:complete len:201 (-) Transcript_6750:2079-2681(-)
MARSIMTRVVTSDTVPRVMLSNSSCSLTASLSASDPLVEAAAGAGAASEGVADAAPESDAPRLTPDPLSAAADSSASAAALARLPRPLPRVFLSGPALLPSSIATASAIAADVGVSGAAVGAADVREVVEGLPVEVEAALAGEVVEVAAGVVEEVGVGRPSQLRRLSALTPSRLSMSSCLSLAGLDLHSALRLTKPRQER